MDQVSDITYRSDGKRLGDENLHSDFGEFRHYIVEKYAYNMANRGAGREPSDVSYAGGIPTWMAYFILPYREFLCVLCSGHHVSFHLYCLICSARNSRERNFSQS